MKIFYQLSKIMDLPFEIIIRLYKFYKKTHKWFAGNSLVEIQFLSFVYIFKDTKHIFIVHTHFFLKIQNKNLKNSLYSIRRINQSRTDQVSSVFYLFLSPHTQL